jgi:hypothetical protein
MDKRLQALAHPLPPPGCPYQRRAPRAPRAGAAVHRGTAGADCGAVRLGHGARKSQSELSCESQAHYRYS